jgi:hypothetical protein
VICATDLFQSLGKRNACISASRLHCTAMTKDTDNALRLREPIRLWEQNPIGYKPPVINVAGGFHMHKNIYRPACGNYVGRI